MICIDTEGIQHNISFGKNLAGITPRFIRIEINPKDILTYNHFKYMLEHVFNALAPNGELVIKSESINSL